MIKYHPSARVLLYKETRHFISDYTYHSSEYRKKLLMRLSPAGAKYEHYTLQEILDDCLIPIVLHLEQTHLLQFTSYPYTKIDIFLRYFVRHDPHLLLNNLARGTFSFAQQKSITEVTKEVHIQTSSKSHMLTFLSLFLIFSLSFTSMLFLLLYHSQRNPSSGLSKNTAVLSSSDSALLSQQAIVPARIVIPKIAVRAAIEQVGITYEGAMDVPGNVRNAGWYNIGPRPGEHGSAVIAGHYDGRDGSSGVFAKLHLLKRGDSIYIEDSDGKMRAFVVRETRTYNPDADASSVFGQSGGSHLNLVTCEGLWDQTKESYSKRLVVFADAIY